MSAAARAEIQRLVVDAHGAKVAAIPAEVDAWLDDVFERCDQGAVDEAIHWIFSNAPTTTNDLDLATLVAMVSKAGRG